MMLELSGLVTAHLSHAPKSVSHSALAHSCHAFPSRSMRSPSHQFFSLLRLLICSSCSTWRPARRGKEAFLSHQVWVGEHTQLSGILVFTGIPVYIVFRYTGMYLYMYSILVSWYAGILNKLGVDGCGLECKPHIFTSFPPRSAMLWNT